MAVEPTIELKSRGGVQYWHVTFPSFTDGEPEVAVNYWANGRISLLTARVHFVVRSLFHGKTGSSLDIQRTSLVKEDGNG